MNRTRRNFLLGSAFATATAVTLEGQHEGHTMPKPPSPPKAVPKRSQGKRERLKPDVAVLEPTRGGPVSMDTPDVPKMPWIIENGVKVFHIKAEVVRREFIPGKVIDCWGFNGSMPGPTIEVNQGDRLRFIVENHLPEVFSMHWHGIELPIEMDGVPGVTQDPIPPGGKFTYEWEAHQHGTFFYHSHMAMQEMMGMIGLLIIHPREPYEPRVDRDFGLIFQEWAILPNNTIPNTMSMEFNWLTINGKAGPDTTPLLVKQGERVRIRMVNLGMDHHPIHLHGNTFYVTGTEGGRVPGAAWTPANTVLLGVAQARDVEFEAKYLGDWMLHCHLPHHMMNQMASMVGPLTHVGQGMHAGMGMEEGMGMIRDGHALSENNGPSLGRGLGVGSTFEEAVTHLPVSPQPGPQAQHPTDHSQHHQPGGPAAVKLVPGYPQDMFMVMDELISKPETHGLRPTWTAGMMGMMTLVRVLTPEKYDGIQRLKQNWKPGIPKSPQHKH